MERFTTRYEDKEDGKAIVVRTGRDVDAFLEGEPGYEAANKLAEYEDLEEREMLVKLPCRVGDDVYVITPARKHIVPVVVLNISVFVFSVHSENLTDIEINVAAKNTTRRLIYHLGDIGKVMFLSREAAERKLKELKQHD